MIQALIPLITGVLSAGGMYYQNKANKAAAQKTMDFQERMSSTSAQRSVDDYRKAGLNPALAYERGASTPSGATPTMGDPINQGISSAQSARALQQQLRIAQTQSDADLRVKNATVEGIGAGITRDTSQRDVNYATAGIVNQRRLFDAIEQPLHLRSLAANAAIDEYAKPGAKNIASLEELLGKLSPAMGTARTAAEILKSLIPRGTVIQKTYNLRGNPR